MRQYLRMDYGHLKKSLLNILFIGGAGFIGSSLVKRFVSDRKYLVFILEPEFANISRLNGYDLTVLEIL